MNRVKNVFASRRGYEHGRDRQRAAQAGQGVDVLRQRAPYLIGIEACGRAHHWACELTVQGHAVRLIHARTVRAFVFGNKTDATDARPIWLAFRHLGTQFVGVKTLMQQATLTLQRQREMDI